MENQTYNGWSNYDTWKLYLNLTNINMERALKMATNKDLKAFEVKCIKTWHSRYYDKDIDYTQVNFKEIYDHLKEYYHMCDELENN